MEIIYVEKVQPFRRDQPMRNSGSTSHPEGFRWEVLNKAKLPPGWSCTSRMVTTNASQNYQRQVIN